MQDNKAILTPEATYHIYNRANGDEVLFVQPENYRFFLEKYKNYISPIADTFCYCLMPNHFHFLIRIKSFSQLCQEFQTLTELNEAEISNFLSRQFSHLLNGYTQAFNKQEGRKGSLFMRPFKRKRITDENYLRKLVHYIHRNPIEAKISKRLDEWKYSSYKDILSSNPTLIVKEEVIDWFGDKENFIYCHNSAPKKAGIEI